MKIFFIADLHLGASYKNLPLEKQRERKSEIYSALGKIFDDAKRTGAGAIVFGGDVFHAGARNKQAQKFLFDLIERCGLNCYMILGNHDENILLENLPTNLKLVLKESEIFNLKENVKLCLFPYGTRDFSILKNLNKSDFNIAVLHGDIYNSADKSFVDLNLLVEV